MKKPFTLTLVVILAFLSLAAIKFFTDYPNSTPLDSDFFVLQRNQSYINSTPAQVRTTWFNNPVFTGSGSIGGNWAVGGQYFGDGSQLTGIKTTATNITYNILYVTNLFSTNIFTTNLFVTVITNTYLFTTNVVIGPGGGLTNFNLTPSSLMKSDNLDAEASVPNGSGFLTNNGAGLFGWLPLSALQGAFIANNNGVGTNISMYGTNFFTEIDDTTAYLTNTTINSLALQTNLWGGPTNIINLTSGNRQTYTSATATSITGVSNKGSTTIQPVTLKLFNSAGTNWLLTLASTIVTRDGSRQYTCTNGQYLIVTVEYDSSFNCTNSLNAPNY